MSGAAHSDAELIAIAGAAEEGFQALLASAATSPLLSDADHDALYDRTYAFSDCLVTMRATTPEGLAAKAMVLRSVMQLQIPSKPGETVEEYGDHHDLLAWSLSGDLLAGAAREASDPDAELILLCAEHAINHAAYNADGGKRELDSDPLWAAYERTRDAITEAVPHTLDGMLAKARAAKVEATYPDGTENPDNCPAARWAWDLVNDLLAGRART